MIKKLRKLKLVPTIVIYLLIFFVRLLSFTYRVKIDDQNGYLKEKNPQARIWAIWHNRLLFLASLIPKKYRKNAAFIASASGDGEYASRFISHFGLKAIRGSSSRGGAKAARELKREIDNNYSVAITVDGPRGPLYTVQGGAAFLARKTECEIVPLMINAPHRWELKSWDKTQIPKPFSKVTLILGKAITVKEIANCKDRKAVSELLLQRMIEYTKD